MSNATATGKPAVSKQRKPRTPQPTEPSSEPPFERIELQCPVGWTDAVDAAAKALGLSRSAYIRMAVNKEMERDRQARKETPQP